MYNEVLLMQLLASYHFGYNPEYENLSDEEKYYMDYCDECLSDRNEHFTSACTRIMLFILDAASKMGTENEFTQEEVEGKKQELYFGFG